MEERERKSAKADSKDTAAAAAGPSSAPVPDHAPGPDSQDGDDDAEKTDVCSDKFDPLLALYSPNVSLPFPNIKSFNNVAEYESFLRGGRGRAKPENMEKKRLKAMKGVADPERIERLKKLMVNNPLPESERGEGSGTPRGRRRDKPQKNVLTRMPLCKGSPLGELYRCVEERIRVKVHIRTFKGLRGVCSGFIVAFDKFWNMAMVDVDETYREPLFGEAFYHEKALTITRLFEKLKLQESAEGDEPAKTDEAQKQASKRQPVNTSTTQTSQSSQPADSRGERGHTEPVSSDAVKTAQDKYKAALKAQGSEGHQKKQSQPYGKVHTRHINQLFIRVFIPIPIAPGIPMAIPACGIPMFMPIPIIPWLGAMPIPIPMPMPALGCIIGLMGGGWEGRFASGTLRGHSLLCWLEGLERLERLHRLHLKWTAHVVEGLVHYVIQKNFSTLDGGENSTWLTQKYTVSLNAEPQ
ncbi:hypothetical protein INR49_024787, partial [Caranx melampygus]